MEDELHLVALLFAFWFACGLAPADPAPPADIAHYTCPMHPSVKEAHDVPCPICNMDLTPVTVDELSDGSVIVDALRRQHFGVRTQPAKTRPLTRPIRAAGTVKFDHTRTYSMTARAEGWVQGLMVTEPGTELRRGQPVLGVYSEDLTKAQDELLARRGTSRQDAKEKRLLSLGFDQAQIDELLVAGHSHEVTHVRSPSSGVLTELAVRPGDYLEEGTLMARVARLDQVWIEAAIYQDDAAFVKYGTPVRITVPGEEVVLETTVQKVEPWVDPVTRRLVVRAVLNNPEGRLRPGAYVDVTIEAELGEALAVPRDAVLVTGARRVVFVDRGQDRLVPTDVEVGRHAGDWIEIRSGLAEDDPVVTSGAFLVAAESRLRSAEAAWGATSNEP